MWFAFVTVFYLSIPSTSASGNLCPYPIHQTARLSDNTGQTCVISTPIQNASNYKSKCQFFLSSIDCELLRGSLNNPSLSIHQSSTPVTLGLFLSHEGFIDYQGCELQNLNFPRLALNITVLKEISEPLLFMYEEIAQPDDAKCFKLEHPSDFVCNEDRIRHFSPSDINVIHCNIAASSTYTSVKFLVNGKLEEFLLSNMFGQDFVDGVIFFYHHVLDNQDIIITFQALFHINYYFVNICMKQNSLKEDNITRNNRCIPRFSVNLLDNSTYSERYEDLITIRLPNQMFKDKGNYEISIECQKMINGTEQIPGRCKQSKVLEVYIQSRFTAAEVVIISVLILVLLFLILSVAVLFARRKVLGPIPGSLKMLILYDARTMEHDKFVKGAHELLSKLLGIKIFIDVENIKETEHKNPSRWCDQIIREVDYISIVIPPKKSGKRGSHLCRVYELGLNILSQTESAHTRCIKIFLPDSDNSETLNNKLQAAPSFKIPDDYYILRQYLQHSRFILPGWLFKRGKIRRLYGDILEDIESKLESNGYSDEDVALLPEHTTSAESDTSSYQLEEKDMKASDLNTIFDLVPSVNDLEL